MTRGWSKPMVKSKLIRFRFSLLLVVSHCASAQTLRVSRAGAVNRADARLAKMTLDEKLTLVGGINDFYTQAIPRLGIRQFRMSDGRMTAARPRLIPLRRR